jgi:hypothetical protein
VRLTTRKQAAVKPQPVEVQEKKPIGHPLKYTPEFFSNAVDIYINNKEEPITITGFCNSIGTSRELLSEYKDRPEFVDCIKRLRGACENYAVNHLFNGKNPVGAIFYLKNMFDWADKQEISQSNTNVLIAAPASVEHLAGAFQQFLLAQQASQDAAKIVEAESVKVVE